MRQRHSRWNNLRIQPGMVLHPVIVKNGWLTVDGKVLVGTQAETSWWQGHVDPQRAEDFGPAITRFAPGRTGQGVTDDLDELTDSMVKKKQAAFASHWGLWYDERRQDHQQVHRLTPDVVPVAEEQSVGSERNRRGI